MFHASSHPFTRRRFAAWAFGGSAAALAGCGGGSQPDPQGVAGLLPRRAGQGLALEPGAGPGLISLPQDSVSAPTEGPLRLAALSSLQDGGFAIAWFARDGTDTAAPWRLQVQRYTRTYERAGDAIRMSSTIADEGAAVTVLRDGMTLVAWRAIVTARPDEPQWIDVNLYTSRFDPTGAPVGEPSLVHTFSHNQDSRNGRRLDAPAIANWPDGSYVVGWADVTLTPTFPNLLATLQARRYHANGWPMAQPLTVSASATSSQFELQALEYTGGYVVRHQGRPTVPSDQVIRLLDFWNPIDPSRFSDLAVGSLLVPLGVCGHLLFAGRPAGDASVVRWERQLFNWSGQPVGDPVPLPGPPQGAVPLRQLGQFLALMPSLQPGWIVAQRMDKYGALYGTPFDFPHAATLPLDDGGLVAAWVFTSKSGMNTLTLQRFIDPYEGQWLAE